MVLNERDLLLHCNVSHDVGKKKFFAATTELSLVYSEETESAPHVVTGNHPSLKFSTASSRMNGMSDIQLYLFEADKDKNEATRIAAGTARRTVPAHVLRPQYAYPIGMQAWRAKSSNSWML